ncbi:MAG: glycosyltransferase [candidate division Zixibacteria bacterium]|nr:glycosyltransferase [candidate division Zixibacteria bacterium]
MSDVIDKGEELFANGKIDEAENYFREILKHDSENKEAHNNLGVIAFQKNDLKAATECFTTALKIDPSYSDPRDSLETIRGMTQHNRLVDEDESAPEVGLVNTRLAIVNPFDNKFSEIYGPYFSRNNEVQVLKPSSERDLKPIVEWADIIWSVWCNEPLVYLSRLKKSPVLVTHIHSYEILAPNLMTGVDWQNVDGAIFVADHIREIANEMWATQLSSVPQTTVYNCVELPSFPFYDNGPGGNICYVGYLNHKKGIGLLLQCIREAVKIDKACHFHIAGAFQEKRFEVYMKHLISEMGLTAHVDFYGWVKDVPTFLKEMNYVISTSPWEGCPCNIIEAMACGVKPLIHNWRGAKDLFPESLVFDTLDDFRTLLTSSDYEPNAYRQYVEINFNAAINLPKIDTFLATVVGQNASARGTARVSPVTSPTSESPESDDTKSQQQSKPETINFYQPLTKGVGFIDNRKQFTVDFCKGKRVLHIGCVDTGIMEQRILKNNFLHYHIGQVAKNLVGVDINEDGIKHLSDAGYDVHLLNIETDDELLKKLSRDVDVIVIPEVIEHLDNAGMALNNLKACGFRGDILISTPNAFSYRTFQLLANNVELVHPDHNYYYSVTTLTTLLGKHGLEIRRLLMYYWSSNDEIGRRMPDILRSCPYHAEGIIAIVNDKDM